MEKSTIIIPDPRHEGEGIIIIGTPEGQRVIRGFDGVVEYDSTSIRGEQPESPIYSDHGALRGDAPLSETEQGEV